MRILIAEDEVEIARALKIAQWTLYITEKMPGILSARGILT